MKIPNIFKKFSDYNENKEIEKKIKLQKEFLIEAQKYITKIKVDWLLAIESEIQDYENETQIHMKFFKKAIYLSIFSCWEEYVDKVLEFDRYALLNSKKLSNIELDLIYLALNTYKSIVLKSEEDLLYYSRKSQQDFALVWKDVKITEEYSKEKKYQELVELRAKWWPRIKNDPNYDNFVLKVNNELKIFEDLTNKEIQDFLREAQLDYLVKVFWFLNEKCQSAIILNVSKRAWEMILEDVDDYLYEYYWEKVTFESVEEAIENIKEILAKLWLLK